MKKVYVILLFARLLFGTSNNVWAANETLETQYNNIENIIE